MKKKVFQRGGLYVETRGHVPIRYQYFEIKSQFLKVQCATLGKIESFPYCHRVAKFVVPRDTSFLNEPAGSYRETYLSTGDRVTYVSSVSHA